VWLRVTLACRSSHTRSIRFSFGLYGGRKCNRIRSPNPCSAACVILLS
jgi:hypothetical protein